MDTKGLQKEFINWCKSKNKQPKTEDETKQLFVTFMKEKHPEEYNKAVENQKKQQTTKALHGTKLNYIKTLKHQCADDEELVYYKVGGKVDCGCKKKGGDIEPKKECGGGAVSKFKMARKAESGWLTRLADATGSQGGFRRAQQEKKKSTNNQQKEGWRGNDYIVRKKNIEERKRQLASNKTKDETTPPNINKGLHKNSKGGAVAEFKKARCGSKMKKK